MQLIFLCIIFIIIIFIIYLIINKQTIENFITENTNSDDLEVPIPDKYLPIDVNYQTDNSNDKSYSIIDMYKYILNRQPTRLELIKARELSENELKLRLLNTPEYNHMSNMQNNDASADIEGAIAKEDLLLKIKKIYKNEKEKDVDRKMLLPLRDCIIYLQYNEYLFRALLDNNKYNKFEKQVLGAKTLNKDILLTLFNDNFDLLELKLVANNIIKQELLNGRNYSSKPDTLISSKYGSLITKDDDNYFNEQSAQILNNADRVFNKDNIASKIKPPTVLITAPPTAPPRPPTVPPSDGRITIHQPSLPSQNNHPTILTSSTSLTPAAGTITQTGITNLNTVITCPTWNNMDSSIPLISSSPEQNGNYGYSCAISGNVMVIGAHGENTSGAVYIYTYDNDHKSWITIPPMKIVASVQLYGARFGYSCAIYGNTIIIGSPGKGAGEAYVYTFNGTTWVKTVDIISPNNTQNNNFGCSCDIYNNSIVIGSNKENRLVNDTNVQTGRAYLYTRTGSVWNVSTPIILNSNSPTEDGEFGYCCKIYDSNIIIGAPGEKSTTINNCGSVYIYNTNGGSSWSTSPVKLTSPNSVQNGNFGYSIAISSDNLVIGAFGENNSAGAAYLYKYTPTTNWTAITPLKFTSNSQITNNIKFGNSCSIYGNTLIIGCINENNSSGKAYIYTYNGSVWSIDNPIKLVSSASVASGQFGRSVVVYGKNIIIASSENYITGNAANFSGVVYLYSCKATVEGFENYKKVYDPIYYKQEFRGIPEERPGVCTALDQSQKVFPTFTESKLLYHATDIDKAFEEPKMLTSNKNISYEYREYEYVKI